MYHGGNLQFDDALVLVSGIWMPPSTTGVFGRLPVGKDAFFKGENTTTIRRNPTESFRKKQCSGRE